MFLLVGHSQLLVGPGPYWPILGYATSNLSSIYSNLNRDEITTLRIRISEYLVFQSQLIDNKDDGLLILWNISDKN